MNPDHCQHNYSGTLSTREYGQCRDEGFIRISSQPALVNMKRFKFRWNLYCQVFCNNPLLPPKATWHTLTLLTAYQLRTTALEYENVSVGWI